mmetsp:Transcript_33907/g.88284  ORF Transcript_33907/g.88284 Transcript_33907/m.88284 type:complete len:525 (+) Transcript_33907:962-2536(+)
MRKQTLDIDERWLPALSTIEVCVTLGSSDERRALIDNSTDCLRLTAAVKIGDTWLPSRSQLVSALRITRDQLSTLEPGAQLVFQVPCRSHRTCYIKSVLLRDEDDRIGIRGALERRPGGVWRLQRNVGVGTTVVSSGAQLMLTPQQKRDSSVHAVLSQPLPFELNFVVFIPTPRGWPPSAFDWCREGNLSRRRREIPIDAPGARETVLAALSSDGCIAAGQGACRVGDVVLHPGSRLMAIQKWDREDLVWKRLPLDVDLHHLVEAVLIFHDETAGWSRTGVCNEHLIQMRTGHFDEPTRDNCEREESAEWRYRLATELDGASKKLQYVADVELLEFSLADPEIDAAFTAGLKLQNSIVQEDVTVGLCVLPAGSRLLDLVDWDGHRLTHQTGSPGIPRGFRGCAVFASPESGPEVVDVPWLREDVGETKKSALRSEARLGAAIQMRRAVPAELPDWKATIAKSNNGLKSARTKGLGRAHRCESAPTRNRGRVTTRTVERGLNRMRERHAHSVVARGVGSRYLAAF